MRVIVLLASVVFASLSAGQPMQGTIRPTTQAIPSDADIHRARKSLDIARTGLEKSRSAVIHRFEATALGKAMQKAVADADAAKEEARASGDAQAKLYAAKVAADARKAMSEEIESLFGLDADSIVAKTSFNEKNQAYLRLQAIRSKQLAADAERDAKEKVTREAAAKAKRIIDKDADATEITSKQIEITGDKFLKVRVRMSQATFESATNRYLQLIPGVTVATDGSQAFVDTEKMNQWVGFSVTDADGNDTNAFFASKKVFGDTLVAMKRGTKITVYGEVVGLRTAGDYGIICDKIEIAK